jgi:hypothetical protein
MGIDVHTLMFLICETKEHGPLGSVATIGRQGLDVPSYWLKRLLLSATQSYGRYCEQVLIENYQKLTDMAAGAAHRLFTRCFSAPPSLPNESANKDSRRIGQVRTPITDRMSKLATSLTPASRRSGAEV